MWVWKMAGPSLARPPPTLAGNRIFRYSVCLCVCVCTTVCHGRPCRRMTAHLCRTATHQAMRMRHNPARRNATQPQRRAWPAGSETLKK